VAWREEGRRGDNIWGDRSGVWGTKKRGEKNRTVASRGGGKAIRIRASSLNEEWHISNTTHRHLIRSYSGGGGGGGGGGGKNKKKRDLWGKGEDFFFFFLSQE